MGLLRRLIAPALFGIAGTAVLLALGFWQVQRLGWKTGILTRIEARIAAEPVAVPAHPDPESDQYLRVAARGTIRPGELHVYTSVPPHGVGYRVIAPFELADGRRILLDRGFVPIEAKDAVRRRGAIAVQGTLHWPRERDRFTAEPDLAANVWLARDVPAMAAALDTLPVMLVTAASDDPDAPLPLPVSINIPNDHLGYAVTWFGLAAIWSMMTLGLLWRISRRTD